MAIAKAGLVVLWILSMASFFLPPESLAAEWGPRLFWLLVVVHGGEFLFFIRTFRSAPGGLIHHFLWTMVLGFFHIRQVQGQDSAPSSSS